MADLDKALSNVKSLARTFQSVIDLADAMTQVASVEQAAREAQARLDGHRKEAEAVQGAIANARAQTAAMMSSAKAEAEKANQATEKARKDAQLEVETARAYAAQIRRDADEQVKTSLDAAEKKLHAINATVNARTQELSDLEARISKAKAKMAEMLGVGA